MTKTPELVIEVCSRDEAGAILSSPSRRADVAFVVSIGEPKDNPPAGFARLRNKLRLVFSDSNDELGPTDEDVRRLISTAKALQKRGGRVVVHCQAGISRSSAAAIVIYAVILGSGKEKEAVDRVFAQRPIALPNKRLIAVADRLLGNGGALTAAVDARLNEVH